MKTINIINRLNKLPLIVLMFMALVLAPKWGYAQCYYTLQSDAPAETCTNYSKQTVTSSWKTTSLTTLSEYHYHVYEFDLLAGRTYTFTTCSSDCSNASADFDTYLQLRSGTGCDCTLSTNWLDEQDGGGGCGYDASTITYTPSSDMTVAILVSGYSNYHGKYKLAYKYTGSYHTLSSAVYPSDKGTVTLSSTSILDGSSTTISATATATGYTFSHWTVSGSGASVASTSNSSTTFYMGSENATVTANFKNTYTVTLNNQSATTAGTTSVTATYGSAMPSITPPTKTNYTFGGYYTGTEGSGTKYYNADGSSAKNWDKTTNTILYAKWTPAGYSVTASVGTGISTAYVAAGTSFSGTSTSVTVSSGGSATFQASVTSGYTFDGWYDGSTKKSGSLTYTESSISSAITRTAKATENSYSVTFYNGGHGSVTVAGNPIEDGGTATVTQVNTKSLVATANTGYTFDGWTRSTTNITIDNTSNASTNIKASSTGYVTANWTANTYTITYKDQGNVTFSGTHGSGYPTSHTYGTATSLVSPSKAGYRFDGWFTASACTGSPVTSLGATAYTADITLYAKWTDVMDVDNISVSGSTTIDCGSTTTLTADGIPGVVYKWYRDSGCTDLAYTGASFTTPTLTANTTYYVKAVLAGAGPLTEGTATPFEYSGDRQTYDVLTGTAALKLEVWGAQGGNAGSSTGGKGGYSVGTLSSPSGTLYICVGGQGTTDNGSYSNQAVLAGGWNGGGAGRAWSGTTHNGGGGGGATHIAKAAPSSGTNYQLRYYSSNKTDVLIIAGGGGGASDNGNGGAGGGDEGIAGSGSGGCDPGTQSGGSAWGYATDCSYTGGECGGGGGGYYGGYSATAENYAGGGGSGYVNTAFLTATQKIAGNASMPNPSGGSNITGRSGNGYARITPYTRGDLETAAKAVTVTVSTPATPTGLTYSDVTSTTATVSWNAGSASSWQYSTNNGSTWSSTITTNSVNLTGLTPNTTINFKVKVVSGSCESDPASTSFTTLQRYTITAIPGSNGKVRIGSSGDFSSSSVSTDVDHGGSCSLYAQANDGYSFVNWTKTGGGTSTDNPLNLSSITAAAEYTANFAVNGHTVTVSGSNGTYLFTGAGVTGTTANTATVTDGGACTITATAATGYTFLYLTDDDNSNAIVAASPTMSYAIASVTGNRNFTAHFVQEKVSGNWAYAVTSQPAGYTESGSTVTISDANGLAWLISKVNGLNDQTADYSGKTINLTADVNMSGNVWVPIGTAERPFTCTFEGNGHTISGITRSTEFPYQGLFGYVSGGTIHDVVVNTNLTGNSLYSGGVVGYLASGSTVYNTGSTGTVSAGSNTIAVGGTVGYNAGLVHSSFAVGTVTGQSGDYVGGLVGSNTGGRVFNSYTDASISGGYNGGLVGQNTGTVANCYANGISGIYAFAYTNSGSSEAIQYCYADATGTDYAGGTAPTAHGLYSTLPEPESFSLKSKDYMYRDNLITLESGEPTTYVPATLDYDDDDHTILWNGLVSALNQWVAANPNSVDNLSKWYRPLTPYINGDLPVLGFSGETTLGAANASPKVLKYGGLDALLSGYGSGAASVFLYGKESSVSNPPGSDTHVYLAEDAVLIQASLGTENFARTTAGITFDNSCGEDVSTQGKPLDYDWHLMSTPFNAASIGITYSHNSGQGAGSNADIYSMSGGFFPNDLTMTTPAPSGQVKWDLYAFDESNHLWVNFKRNKANHYNADGINITYNGADQTTGNFTPGKGYMMAISQPTYMCTENGTLNNREIDLTLTNTSGSRDSGANLIGNPYHGYLDLNKITTANSKLTDFYVYDADQKTFALYAKRASRNTRAASRYVHPHQGFFVIAPSGGTSLTLSPSMVGTTDTDGHFRDDEQVNYPLVNLFVENELGQRDMATIELHRPELGGAMKIDQLRNTDFEIAARMNSERYALLFTPEGTERVPVNFRTETDGTYKLTWDTQNGEFYSLFLVDNKTGMTYNMLANDTYTFEANSRDYASRFYITYDCSGTGIEENNEDNGGYGIGNFAYIDNGNIVVDVETQNFASLQVIDMLGRVLYSTTCGDGARTVSTNGLSKGVYVIRLTTDKGTQTQKIVVQ